MLYFSYKLIKSLLSDCKKELFFVFTGMVICLCLLINFADRFFSFDNGYGTVTDKEAMEYLNNRIYFTFSNIDKVDDIVEQLKQISGIDAVYLQGNVGQAIQCGTKLPLIKENELVTGSIPKQLSNGQIITSYTLLFDRMPTNEAGEIITTTEEDTESLIGKEYLGVGEKFQIGSNTYTNVAEMNDPEGHIVTLDDFIHLYKECGQGGIDLFYVYKDGFTEAQKKDVESLVTSIKKPETIQPGIGHEEIDFSFFLETIRDLILGLIIASLNSLFLYAYLLEKRIQVYTILKLQGLTNFMLRGMLFLEFLFLYIISCVSSIIIYGIYSIICRNPWYHTEQICLYCFGIVFIINIFLFLIFTWKLVKRQPFEMYQKKST